MAFFQGCPVGWARAPRTEQIGGVQGLWLVCRIFVVSNALGVPPLPTGAGLVDGGVDGVGWGEGWGLVYRRVSKGSGGSKGFGSGGVGGIGARAPETEQI